MRDPLEPRALHAALQFVTKSSVLQDHKATLIGALLQALREREIRESKRQAAEPACEQWNEHEVAQLRTYLQDRVACSWQDADEAVMHLAAQLHHHPRSVRDKATEVGLGASVDYELSRALTKSHSE
jgi:hypothetical protein